MNEINKNDSEEQVLDNKLLDLNIKSNLDFEQAEAFWNCVVVEGYTAEDIAKKSKYMNGEGAFILLIELRENPESAKNRINRGFKLK